MATTPKLKKQVTADEPKRGRGRPKSTTPKDKSKGARLSSELTDQIKALSEEEGLPESEIFRRLIRLSLQSVSKDRTVLYSKDAAKDAAKPSA